MKLKNKDILKFVNGCTALREKKLPVRLGYAIKKNLGSVSDAANAYNTERSTLISRYAEKDNNAHPQIEEGRYRIKDKENFEKDLNELLEIETEVNIHQVTLEEIEKCEDPRYDALTVTDLETLEVMTE